MHTTVQELFLLASYTSQGFCMIRKDDVKSDFFIGLFLDSVLINH